MKKKVEIIICGDLCPTEDTKTYFENNDSNALFNDVLPVFDNADFVFGNLEFVLTDSPKKIKKAGPVLHGKTNYIKVLKKAGIQAVSLANNHIKDCGEEGVKSTIKACKENDIDFFGAGENITKAKEPYIKIVEGYKIGVITFAEQEFNVATATEYGSSFLDPYEDYDKIQAFKKNVDYLIVLYHGGIEHYEYPSPLLQKKCRKFIEKGADLVTCQHSHCIGTIENYSYGTILYGQGNTLFGYREGNDSWNQGLLIKLNFNNLLVKPTLELIPIHTTKKGISCMEHFKGIELLARMHKRSKKITNTTFIEKSWITFCNAKKALYLPYLFGFGRYFISLNRILKNKLVTVFYSKRAIRTNHNVIRCEAHNEVIHTILNNLNK
jgi:poly-gamma-glutamate capsule biosynthesis protein CapA/YwtB (metallophosphatase superfamily)